MKSGLEQPKFMLRTSLRALSVDICTAAGLGLAGDVICQRLEGTDPINLRRLTAVTVYDGLYIGGVLHFLYKLYSPATRAAANILSHRRRYASGCSTKRRSLTRSAAPPSTTSTAH